MAKNTKKNVFNDHYSNYIKNADVIFQSPCYLFQNNKQTNFLPTDYTNYIKNAEVGFKSPCYLL